MRAPELTGLVCAFKQFVNLEVVFGAACVRLVVLSPPVQPASGPLTRLGDLSRIFIKLVNTTLQLWPCPCCLPSPWVSTSKGPGLVVGAYGEASPC